MKDKAGSTFPDGDLLSWLHGRGEIFRAQTLRRIACGLAVLTFAAPLAGHGQDASQALAAGGPAAEESAQGEDMAVPSLPAAPATPEEAEQMMQALYADDPAAGGPVPQDTANERRNWRFIPSFTTGFLYDDNLFISHSHPESDVVTIIAGGGEFGLGDFEVKSHNYITLSYEGTGFLFGKHTEEDAYDQAAAFQGQADFGRLQLQAHFDFQDLSGADIDVGDRTKRRLYDTNLVARYDLDEKFYLQVEGDSMLSHYETQSDAQDWVARCFLNYKWSPELEIGAGAGAGLLEVADAASETYQQFLGRTKYSLSEKVSLEGRAGVEWRESATQHRVTPIFKITVNYCPEEETTFGLSAYRQTRNSAILTGDDYVSTGVALDFHRTMFGRGDFGFNGGYEHNAYNRFSRGQSPDRTDNYYYLRPSFSWAFVRNCRLEVFYKCSQDASSLRNFSFRDRQAGVELTLSF